MASANAPGESSGASGRRKRRRASEDFAIQVTSLIDTLVIILAFMLMTVGSGAVNLEMAQNVNLPWALDGGDLTQGVKLITRTDGIYIEEEKIVDLTKKATVPGKYTSEKGKKIIPLFRKLAVLAVESKKAASESKIKFEGKVMIQADKDIPHATIKKILYTAARAGYHDFNFAVIRQ